MEADFWRDKWARDDIGFHEQAWHPMLVRHWSAVAGERQTPVFVPLAGKSRDMRFLREAGHEVIGVELASQAVEGFFKEHNLVPDVASLADFRRHEAAGYTLLEGDYFDVTPAHCAHCELVYDRAALIALPAAMRLRYVAHLRRILMPGTRIFLITVNYPPDAVSGPPFSVTTEEVERLFGDWCTLRELETNASTVRQQPVEQSAWRLDVNS